MDATSRKYREATFDGADGVVLVKQSSRWLTNTTPSAPAKEASQLFFSGAATPPQLRRGLLFGCGFAALCVGGLLTASAQAPQERPQAVFDRAVADFMQGRIAESVAGFDNLAKLVPQIAPELWQRGIALYYAGRYKDCRAQFESHRTVNPNDVENAAWHFLCVARAESPDKAKSALLPVGPDARVPMRQVYEMFRGTLTPQQVLAAAGTQPLAQFYAHLYLGLYYEAVGNKPLALEHIKTAAADRFAAGGYMHSVAKVHLAILQR